VLQEQLKTADAAMKSAGQIADEEQKIKKMGEANDMLAAGFIRGLDDIKDLKQKVKNAIIDMNALRLEHNEREGARTAARYADDALYKTDERLRDKVENRSQAESLTGLVLSDLRAAQRGIERIISTVKERENRANQKIAQEKADKDQVQAKKEEAARPIKCAYCGTLNPAGSVKCKSCGAPFQK
jgi:membrane-associated HD superfamily phosphohydrolase